MPLARMAYNSSCLFCCIIVQHKIAVVDITITIWILTSERMKEEGTRTSSFRTLLVPLLAPNQNQSHWHSEAGKDTRSIHLLGTGEPSCKSLLTLLQTETYLP